MPERTCTKCGETKPETTEFFGRRGTKDRGGLRPDCKVCVSARDRAYVERNADRIRAQRAAYRASLPADVKRERERAYTATEAGREVRRRATRRFNNSDAGRRVFVLAQHRRRAKKAATGSRFTAGEWDACVTYFASSCAYCGAAAKLTQDHVVPLSGGGDHAAENIVPACGSCNSRKFTSDMETWFRAQPFFNAERLAIITDYSAGVAAA